MNKTGRRKRRTNRSATRKHGTKRAVQALAAGAVIAAGTQAYADPIRFDNPPGAEHFDWVGVEQHLALELTLDAASQPGDPFNGASFTQRVFAEYSSVAGLGGGDLQTGMGYPADYLLAGVSAGELIPTPGTTWPTSPGYIFYDYFGGSLLPEGTQTYLGARFDLGDGNQYGWIGVVRTGLALDAFAWGYETDPGVPIAAGAPEPGTLALLAFGACAAASRRRRSQLD